MAKSEIHQETMVSHENKANGDASESQMRTQIEDCKKRLSEAASTHATSVDKRKEDLASWKTQCEQKKAKAAAADSSPALALEADIADLDREIDVISSEIETLRNQEQENVGSLQALQEKKSELEQERDDRIRELENETEQLCKDAAALDAEFSVIKKAHEKEEKSLAEKVKRAQDALDKTTKENANAMKMAQLEAGTLKLEETVQKLRAETEMLDAEVQKKKAVIDGATDRKNSLQLQLEQEQQSLNTLTSEFEEKTVALRNEGALAQKQANEITQKTNERIDDSTKTKQEIQESELKYKELTIRFTENEAFLDEHKGKLKDLKEKTIEFQREKIHMTSEIVKVEKSLDRERAETAQKVQRLQKKEKEISEKLAEEKAMAAASQKQFDQQYKTELQQAKDKVTQGVKDEVKEESRLLEEARSDNDQLKLRIKALEKALQTEKKKARDANKGLKTEDFE